MGGIAMFDRKPVQTFDLPETCEVDHVAIHPNDNPDEPHFEAVPFVHRGTMDDGTDRYHEPSDFTVTDAYRTAVAERADVKIDDLLLEREIATYGFDTVHE